MRRKKSESEMQRKSCEANEMKDKRGTEEIKEKAARKKKEIYQAEIWPAREERLWLEVMVRLEGATRSILEVPCILLEEALLTWLEIREEVLTDMMTSSN